MTTHKHLCLLALSALLAVAGCTGANTDISSPGDDPMDDLEPQDRPDPRPGNSRGRALAAAAADIPGQFGHPTNIGEGGSSTSVARALDRLTQEGPSLYSSRVHTCRKIRYETLGQLLASRGVDLAAMAETSAGSMYRTGDQALGSPNYAARIAEPIDVTVAIASREFDIFVQAATEMINTISTRAECMVGPTPAQLFDADNNCVESGISCLLGVPATPAHVATCTDIVKNLATNVEDGKRIAVAAMLAAAHTCE